MSAPVTIAHLGELLGKAPISVEPVSEPIASHANLDRFVARARREMGEERWNELNAEWVA